MKKNKGYSIDFLTNTLVMNYKFSQAAEVYGSAEYTIIQGIRVDFPNIKICIKSGREQKGPRYNKRLTYENMEKYIKCFENSDVLLERFEKVKKMSLIVKSPYKFVCDWFTVQFPNYNNLSEFENSFSMITLVPIPNAEDYKQKEAM